jgi:hypothetical protein
MSAEVDPEAAERNRKREQDEQLRAECRAQLDAENAERRKKEEQPVAQSRAEAVQTAEKQVMSSGDEEEDEQQDDAYIWQVPPAREVGISRAAQCRKPVQRERTRVRDQLKKMLGQGLKA